MEPGTVMVDVADRSGGLLRDFAPDDARGPGLPRGRDPALLRGEYSGAVPRTSTLALTNATLPYVLQHGRQGLASCGARNAELALGLNIVSGKTVYRPIAEAWDLPYEPLAL